MFFILGSIISFKFCREKINDILARIPEEFELEDNLTEILKLVLDQELQASFLNCHSISFSG